MTTAPTFLLDANILSYFLNAGRKAELARIASVLPLAVVEEVHDEALQHKARGEEYRKWRPGSGVAVRALSVGGPGAQCLGRLRGASGGLKDLGEHASIALAVEDPSLILVTNDKGGVWLALRELLGPGERTLRFWSFLHRAQKAAGFGQRAACDIANVAHLTTDKPLWWDAWLATLPL